MSQQGAAPEQTSEDEPTTTNITLIGAGTIGLSFAALHLLHNPNAHITIHDPRPDLSSHIHSTLPYYLTSPTSSPSSSPDPPIPYKHRLTLASTLPTAVATAHIIQEAGPENTPWKQSTWSLVESHAPTTALLWTSTSGIPASVQAASMRDPSRLLVVHPYNPPHIMPLLEIVPSALTAPDIVARTETYWRSIIGRSPVVLRKECTGFVANRLAFALLREACGLVAEGVADVADIDEVVRGSMGPRWAVQGVFEAYHAGGGEAGLKGFMEKIGGTVGACWEEGERVAVKVGDGGRWEREVCEQAERVYGRVDVGETARLTAKVLEITKERRGKRRVEELDETGGSKKIKTG